MTEDSEWKLRDLTHAQLLRQLRTDVHRGSRAQVLAATQILLECGWDARRILHEGLLEGMREVGRDCRAGLLFVPEVLRAVDALKAAMAVLRPLIGSGGGKVLGKVLIGTVKGDLHDIGKDVVAMMLAGAGFEVIDLGVDTPVERFMQALAEHQPDILAMSALLTTSMPYIKTVIDRMREFNMRNEHIVLVGGGPLNAEFAKAAGADAYCRDATAAVETARSLLAAHRAVRACSRLVAPG